jgi:hypothetical protein
VRHWQHDCNFLKFRMAVGLCEIYNLYQSVVLRCPLKSNDSGRCSYCYLTWKISIVLSYKISVNIMNYFWVLFSGCKIRRPEKAAGFWVRTCYHTPWIERCVKKFGFNIYSFVGKMIMKFQYI